MAKRLSWNEILRRAVKASGLSLYRVSKDTGIAVSPIQVFMAGGGLTLSSAEKIGRLVGVELRRVPRKKRKGR
jgi:hypothetical protein